MRRRFFLPPQKKRLDKEPSLSENPLLLEGEREGVEVAEHVAPGIV